MSENKRGWAWELEMYCQDLIERQVVSGHKWGYQIKK